METGWRSTQARGQSKTNWGFRQSKSVVPKCCQEEEGTRRRRRRMMNGLAKASPNFFLETDPGEKSNLPAKSTRGSIGGEGETRTNLDHRERTSSIAGGNTRESPRESRPEAAMITAWELWKIRNDSIFGKHEPSFSRWFCNFQSQCLLQSVRFKGDLRSSFCFWLDAFS